MAGRKYDVNTWLPAARGQEGNGPEAELLRPRAGTPRRNCLICIAKPPRDHVARRDRADCVIAPRRITDSQPPADPARGSFATLFSPFSALSLVGCDGGKLFYERNPPGMAGIVFQIRDESARPGGGAEIAESTVTGVWSAEGK